MPQDGHAYSAAPGANFPAPASPLVAFLRRGMRWGWHAVLLLTTVAAALAQSEPADPGNRAAAPATNAWWAELHSARAFAIQGDKGQALHAFKLLAQQAAAKEDPQLFQALWSSCLEFGFLAQAYACGTNYLALAPQGVPTPEWASVARYTAEWELRQVPHYVTNVPPRELSMRAFRRELRRKLPAEQAAALVSPLRANPAMNKFAQQRVAGATNDLQRARVLYETLAERIDRNPASLALRHRTAAQAFAEWGTSNAPFHCQDAAYLYVALARSVGLNACFALVEQTPDGQRSSHGCAAVHLGQGSLLVDPAYAWFGAPHQKVVLLDDVGALALYLTSTGGASALADNEAAVKLCPSLELAQHNLCSKFIELERWEDAARVLPVVEKLDIDGRDVNALRARFAIHDRRWEEATAYLLKGISLNPEDVVPHALLGEVYAAQGKVAEAKKAYQDALACPHNSDQAEAINRSLEAL